MDDINRYFEILGLKPGASLDEVKGAYKDLVKVWHPDRFAHDPKLQQKAQEKLKEINEAYEKLKAYYAEYGNQPPPKEEYQSDSSYQKNDSYQENTGNKNYENSASEPPKEPPYEKDYKNAKQNDIKLKTNISYKYLPWAFVAFGYLLANEFLASFSGVHVVIIYAIVGGLVGAIGYAVVKGINSLNVSKKKKIRTAWIVGIVGFIIVMVIFKVRTDKQSSPIDDCILKYQKEAKCKQASAIINLACRGKYSDTATDCILKNIGDAQTDIAAISILRSCQNKYPYKVKSITELTDEELLSITPATPAPAPAPMFDYVVQGENYYSKGLYQDALQSFSKAVELDPRNSVAYNDMGWALFALGNYAHAVGYFTKAIELNPSYDFPHKGLAMAREKLKQFDSKPAPPSTTPQTKYKSPTPNEKFNNSQTELASVPAPEPQLPVKRITERVVTDKETGLVWARDANLGDKDMYKGEALNFVDQLNRNAFAGYKDWRLPTIDELTILAKHGNIEASGFTNVQRNYISSSGASIDINDRCISYFGPNFEHGYIWPVRSDK